MGKTIKLTDATIFQMNFCRHYGFTHKEISKQFKVSLTTVYKYVNIGGKLTTKTIAEMRVLRAKGASVTDLTYKYNVSRGTVYNYTREAYNATTI